MKKFAMAACMIMATAFVFAGCGKSSDETSYKASECVTLKDYKNIEVDCTVKDDEVQAKVDELVTNNTTTKTVKVAKKGDTVNIDYTGKVNGKDFQGNTGKGTDLVLGSKQFIDGFESGLIGSKKGQTKKLHLTFPKNYATKNLQGKKVIFTVKVNKISKSVKPKVTDSFIYKATEKKYKTLKAYKEGMKKELIEANKTNAGSTAFNTVVEQATVVTYPAIVISECATQIDGQMRAYISAYGNGVKFDDYLTKMGMTADSYKSYINEQAKSQAKGRLCWETIAEKENIAVTDEEVKKAVTDLKTQMNAESEDALRKTVKEQYSINDLDAYMKQNKLLEKVYDKLKGYAKIKQ